MNSHRTNLEQVDLREEGNFRPVKLLRPCKLPSCWETTRNKEGTEEERGTRKDETPRNTRERKDNKAHNGIHQSNKEIRIDAEET